MTIYDQNDVELVYYAKLIRCRQCRARPGHECDAPHKQRRVLRGTLPPLERFHRQRLDDAYDLRLRSPRRSP